MWVERGNRSQVDDAYSAGAHIQKGRENKKKKEKRKESVHEGPSSIVYTIKKEPENCHNMKKGRTKIFFPFLPPERLIGHLS
jgi:hypothetical protein